MAVLVWEGILDYDRLLNHYGCLETLVEFSLPLSWVQDAGNIRDAILSLDILLCEYKCLVQPLR